jgi:ubiquinone/menaquinone biosynthesis C-methylase UbiE
MRMNIQEHNRIAWDKMAEEGSEWSKPADHELIEYARKGEIALYLTPSRPCPQEWLPDFKQKNVLALGAGGGYQGPIMAAAGAAVTVLDNSSKQLTIDQEVASKENLCLEIILGDMCDLSRFADASCDIIVNPISNLYIPHVKKVWRESYRILRNGGIMMAGFMNPAFYIFDRDKMDQEGVLEVKYVLPYSDKGSLSEEDLVKLEQEGWPMEFSHSLEDQINGQLEAGFIITGFYEDRDPRSALYDYMPVYIATKAEKRMP